MFNYLCLQEQCRTDKANKSSLSCRTTWLVFFFPVLFWDFFSPLETYLHRIYPLIQTRIRKFQMKCKDLSFMVSFHKDFWPTHVHSTSASGFPHCPPALHFRLCRLAEAASFLCGMNSSKLLSGVKTCWSISRQ